MWKNICRFRKATDDNIIRSMSSKCWITMATDTHSEYVMLIFFPLQQWLCERASMLQFLFCYCFNLACDAYKEWGNISVARVNFSLKRKPFRQFFPCSWRPAWWFMCRCEFYSRGSAHMEVKRHKENTSTHSGKHKNKLWKERLNFC